MSSLIDNLLSNGTLTKSGNVYKCECSEVVLQRGSIRSHVNTKRHLRWLNGDVISPPPVPTENGSIIDEKDECGICYEIRGKFFKCTCCSNNHCMDCHSQMNTCPFCRTRFKVVPVRQVPRPRLSVMLYNLEFIRPDGSSVGFMNLTIPETTFLQNTLGWRCTYN